MSRSSSINEVPSHKEMILHLLCRVESKLS